MKKLIKDEEPCQQSFKPFKYASFKMPIYRTAFNDLMTIYIPVLLLSIMSVYIFFETAEIGNRIMNVSAITFTFAAIQPVIRKNLPNATSITLVDFVIYLQLIANVLFLINSIRVRGYYDTKENAPADADFNNDYNRWGDGLFIANLCIASINLLAIVILVIYYYCKK